LELPVIDEDSSFYQSSIFNERIYEDTVKPEPKQQHSFELAVPSQEVLKELLYLAQSGYVDDLQEVIATLKTSDSRFIPFASRIEDLVENYQFEKIVNLINSSLKKSNYSIRH
jgi:hypothetical protein